MASACHRANVRAWPVLLLAGVICCGRQGGEKPAVNDDESTFVFLVDPTVLEGDAEKEWAKTMRDFAVFYKKLRQMTGVGVLLVEKGVMQKHLLWTDALPLRREYDGPKHHEAYLERSFPQLQLELDHAWKFYHEPERRRQPTSCLLSSLEAARKYADGLKSLKVGGEFVLVVISDLLESCDELGAIHLEHGIDELQKFAPIQAPKLDAFDAVLLVQMPNTALVTPEQDNALIGAWRQLLEKSGIEPQNIIVASGFPPDVPFE